MTAEQLQIPKIEPIQNLVRFNYVGTDILRSLVNPRNFADDAPGSDSYKSRIQGHANCGQLDLPQALVHHQELFRGEIPERCMSCYFNRAIVQSAGRRVVCPYTTQNDQSQRTRLLDRYALKVQEKYDNLNYPYIYLGCTDEIATIVNKIGEIHQKIGIYEITTDTSCVNERWLPNKLCRVLCFAIGDVACFSMTFAAPEKERQDDLEDIIARFSSENQISYN